MTKTILHKLGNVCAAIFLTSLSIASAVGPAVGHVSVLA